jgi:hypothetical protein
MSSASEQCDLVWAKQPGTPWWPGWIAEPLPQHLEFKPATGRVLLVVSTFQADRSRIPHCLLQNAAIVEPNDLPAPTAGIFRGPVH